MAIKKINIGQVPNDKKGDKFRDAFSKANDNFSELDTRATAAQNAADAAKTKADAALPEWRVQADALSAVVGALLAISSDGRGAFGLGSQAAPDWPSLDLDNGSSVPPSGLYRFTSVHTGIPPGGGSSGVIVWIRYTATAGYLAAFSGTSPSLHLRRWVSNVWSPWYRADVRGGGFGAAGTDTVQLAADLDDDTLPSGYYRYTNTSSGVPSWAGAAGTLEIVHQQSGYRTQIITENSTAAGSAGRRGWRVRKNGVWQPWREMMSEGNTVQYGGGLSGGGVDLNQATKRGLYIVPSTSIASDGLNFPVKTSGLLEVLAAYGMDYVGAMTTGLVQRYTSANRNQAFQRTLVNSAWTDWRESAFVDSIFPMLRPSSYTKTTVPAAASSTAGVVYVTNAVGGAALAVSNGTAWISQITGAEI